DTLRPARDLRPAHASRLGPAQRHDARRHRHDQGADLPRLGVLGPTAARALVLRLLEHGPRGAHRLRDAPRLRLPAHRRRGAVRRRCRASAAEAAMNTPAPVSLASLARVVGLWGAVWMGLGSILGTGVFV